MLATPLASASADEQFHHVTGVESWDVLYVRSGPDFSYEKIGSLPYDANSISIEERSGAWCRFTHHSISGWTRCRYFEPDDASVSPEDEPGTVLGVYRVVGIARGSALELRSSPGWSSSVNATVPRNGRGVRVREIRNGWCLSEYRGLHGWAQCRYLREG
jgi:uncharacterized protein YraI